MNTLTVTAIISVETGGQALGLPPSKPSLERSRKVFEKAKLKNDLAKSGLQGYRSRVDSTACGDYRRIHQIILFKVREKLKLALDIDRLKAGLFLVGPRRDLAKVHFHEQLGSQSDA